MGSAEKQLPDGWIRKESKSRPNNFYYFNTKTGKTQWKPPISVENIYNESSSRDNNNAKSTKYESNSKERPKQSGGQSRYKIDHKSKDLKKSTSHTPAQDRLETFVKKTKAPVSELFSSDLVNLKSKTTGSTTNDRLKVRFTIAKKADIVTKRTNDVTDSANSVTINHSVVSIQNDSIADVDKSTQDAFRSRHSSKNIAQERMHSLQLSLSMNNVDHEGSGVFGTSFGIDSAQHSAVSDNMDEEMDWEPCDDANYTFQQLENMAVDVLTDSAYIIPDTNVFLAALVSIKWIIENKFKYTILIPFVVLQELDQLKRRNSEDSVSSKASRAIKFIYEQLKLKNQRIQGQKATEDKTHIIDVTSADDKILNCCLQLQSQSKEIILVTNDINLSNKALLNGIESIISKQCLDRFQ